MGFAEKYITVDLDEYVCLVDDPRVGSSRDAPFTVGRLGNVVGERATYVNPEPGVLNRRDLRYPLRGAGVVRLRCRQTDGA